MGLKNIWVISFGNFLGGQAHRHCPKIPAFFRRCCLFLPGRYLLRNEETPDFEREGRKKKINFFLSFGVIVLLETMPPPAAAAASTGRTRRRLSLLLLAAAAFAVALFLEVGSNSSRGPVVVGKKEEEVCLWLRNDNLNSNIVCASCLIPGKKKKFKRKVAFGLRN